MFFFLNDTATTEIYTLSLHDALPIYMLSQPKPATDEYAVMIDTRDPLEVGEAAGPVENSAYVDSWKAR